MKRCFGAAVFCFACFYLAGCNPEPKEEPIWEYVKIGDLAPWKGEKHSDVIKIKSIGFSVYIFEAPVGRMEALSGIWDILVGVEAGIAGSSGGLHGGRVRFNSYDAFKGNSFAIGLGQGRVWPRFAGVLNVAGASKMSTLSLLATDTGENAIPVGFVGREQTVFYVKSDGSIDAAGVGPGRFVLGIRAARVPGLRRFCSVDVKPAFSAPMRVGMSGSGVLGFDSVGFSLKMSPGDFFVLGPAELSTNGMNLSSYFFERRRPSSGGRMFLVPSGNNHEGSQAYYGPVVRIYMVVCTTINN